jgi:hypothetical protein
MSSEKRVVNSAEDLLLYTDLDESEYPIYLTVRARAR